MVSKQLVFRSSQAITWCVTRRILLIRRSTFTRRVLCRNFTSKNYFVNPIRRFTLNSELTYILIPCLFVITRVFDIYFIFSSFLSNYFCLYQIFCLDDVLVLLMGLNYNFLIFLRLDLVPNHLLEPCGNTMFPSYGTPRGND